MHAKQSRYRMPNPRATLLLTRPQPACDAFLEALAPVLPTCIDVVISPLIEIVPTGQRPDLSDVAGIIFTSANGVRFAGPASPVPAFCVGQATTQVATDHGWDARQVGESADELISSLTRERPEAPLLHIGGVHLRSDLAGRLTETGLRTSTVAVYDQELQPLSEQARRALNDDLPVIVPLFSPRTAQHFCQLSTPMAPIHFVALSEAVRSEITLSGAASCQVADRPNVDSMVRTLANLFQQLERDAAAN